MTGAAFRRCAIEVFGLAEAVRSLEALQRLLRHDISKWALAGGLAVEIHCFRAGALPGARPLNDIDFVAPAFDCIPVSLAADFLFRHVHPLDPPGKTMLQFVDAGTALRIDLFRAYGEIMARTVRLESPFGEIRLISAEDALARAARLLLDLRAGIPVPAKHANDYLRMWKLMDEREMDIAWQDHRRPGQPVTFGEADRLVRRLIASEPGLLTTPEYSKDPSRICPRCAATTPFPLAEPQSIFSLLGYD